MRKALVSLFLSFLTLLLLWLFLPLFILPPIAAWLGWSYYKQSVRNGSCTNLFSKVVHLVPLLASVLVFAWGIWMMTTEYNV